MDIYALDLTTGMTTSYMNVDDSVSLFLSDSFGDKAIFMNFAAAGVHGDYNNNGTVDAADYVVWRDNLNTTNTLPNDPNGGTIDTDQFNTWRANFGKTAGVGKQYYRGAGTGKRHRGDIGRAWYRSVRPPSTAMR